MKQPFSVGSIPVPGVPAWGAAGIGLGVGGVVGAAFWWLYAKNKDKTMTKLEKTLISLVTQLFEHIEKTDVELQELHKRPTGDQLYAAEKQAGVEKARANDARRECDSLRATLADRDRLIATLREPHIVQKTKRRR